MKSEGTLGLFTPPDKLAYENTLEIEINVDKIKQYRSYVNTTLFHELVHALHFHKDRGGFWDRRLTKDFTTICKRANFSKKSAETLRKGYPNAEELKTKVGIYVDNDGIVKYDPVNENGFLYSMCGALQLEYNGELSPDVKKFFTEMVMTGRIPEPISQLDVVIEEWQDYIIFIISIIIILIFLMLHILKKRKKPRIRIVINR
jgi:hypothetical protein